MKHILLIISILSVAITSATDIPTSKTDDGFSFLGIQNGKQTIGFENVNYSIKTIEHMGTAYQKPELGSAGSVVNEGEPYLPSVTTYYAVEPGKTFQAQIEIIDTEIIENVNVIPFHGWERDSFDPETPLARNSSLYSENQLFPTNIVQVSDPIVMRELTMVKVTITPFQYNPITQELTVIQEANITMDSEGTTDAGFRPLTRSRAFEPLYKSMVVNYEDYSRDDVPYQRPSILYVIPSNIGNLMSTIELLMDWKHRLGYEVNYVSSSNVVNNSTNLKNYIEDAYETWDNPPEFVTFFGDASGTYDIPTYYENWSGYNGEGDHPYSQLEGSDLFPEVFLGRMSFSTQSHLNTIVGKILNYEASPYMGEDWFTRACLVGDPSTSGISCVITNENINSILDINGYTDVNTIYSGSFPSQMVSGINEGISFFNYRGYYGVSGFTSSHVNSTSNGFMLPVATVITCGTGSFGGDSIVESFLRAGTASNPKGAVASIGTATTGTHTMFNNLVDMGFYYGTFIDEIETAGAALMQGKLYLAKGYPSNPNNYVSIFTHWNSLMGDASLQMWTKFPSTFNVEYESWVMSGTNYMDIHVASGPVSVSDAWVTILRDGDIFESGYTDQSGNVTLNLPSSESGEVLITVSKKNHVPYQGSFQIYDPGVSVNVVEDYITYNDDNVGQSSGNNDGLINGGETIELYIPFKNYGSEDATELNATLSSNNSQVTFISQDMTIGDLTSDQMIIPENPFIMVVEDGVSEGMDIPILVDIWDNNGGSWQGMVNLETRGNDITAHNINVLGNTYNVLESGQSSEIEIILANNGSTNATSLIGTMISPSPMIDIVDNEGSWPLIGAGSVGSNSTNTFEISVLEGTIPGTIVHLILNLESSDGYETNMVVPVQIGMPTVFDPLGPDDYGYYIYDSGDALYNLAPYYSWVEIDDRQGGPGFHLNSLTDSGNNGDDVETVTLPFSFKFYGLSYDEISICSNGWIAMGESTLESFRNYELPGPTGPSPMIAGFWDDLQLTNGGRVYTYYDQANHQYIVQWSQVRTYQNNSTNTFQIILRDPAYYFGPTGDGEILIQYKEFNNTSYGSYGWGQTHGNYATVGIEDHTMTVGLTYTWNDTYPTASMELGDETAILITTRGSEVRMFGDLNMDEVINLFDILGLVDYILGTGAPINPYLGDINQDGMINVLDMLGLVQIVMGWQ